MKLPFRFSSTVGSSKPLFSGSRLLLGLTFTTLLSGCFDNANLSEVAPPTPPPVTDPVDPPPPDPISCDAPQLPNDDGTACLNPPPVATPEANEAIIFYNRADGEYDGWVLHLWNNDVCPDTVANPTTWPDGPSIAGVDPNYGGYFVVPLLEGHSDCMNFIVHDAAGVKDISQQDLIMDLSSERMIWTFSGVNEIFDEATLNVPVALTGAAAHWVTPSTLVWNIDAAVASDVRLYHAMDADLSFTETGVAGDSFVSLSAGNAENDPAAITISQPNWQAFELDSAVAEDPAQIQQLIRSQLIAVALDANGDLVAATRVQFPRLLDAMFTTGETDADEQTLGIVYQADTIAVNTWAPTAQDVNLVTYGADKTDRNVLEMAYNTSTGVWSAEVPTSMNDMFYRYEVTVYHPITDEREVMEVTDPYSVSLATNGRYSQFIDLADETLKPAGWDSHTIPELEALEDAVIYEGHIRDFSVLDNTVTAANRGKYRAFTEANSTPMQHLQSLVDVGLNYFHILPANDIASVDEDLETRVNITDTVGDLCAVNSNAAVCSTFDASAVLTDVFESFDPATGDAQQLASDMRNFDSFNWGYDPHHFNAPDGSYASNPEGSARILEMREMIMALHETGLRVALDVVYNHTNASGTSINSVFDKMVPGYYHRYNPVTGIIENSTCCDNTATEHRMMEKFMIDSLVMWAEHYKYDSFRFDLMGHIPKSSILAAREAVQAVDADNYFYGEGWDFGEVAGDRLFEQATQKNMAGTEVGTFNDQIREAVRGGALFSNNTAPGTLVVQDKLRMSLAGTLTDYQVLNANNALVASSALGGYASDPADIINYVSKHDNETLWDQLNYTLPADISIANRVRAQNISMAIPVLSQGIPFLQIGGDFLRSKSMDRNSFDGGDWYNRVDFSLQSHNWNIGLPSQQENNARYDEIVPILADSNRAPSLSDVQFASDVFKEILQIRSSSRLFRLPTAEEISARIGFHNAGSSQQGGLIVMSIDDGTGLTDLDPNADALVLMINGTPDSITHAIPTATGFSLHPVLANSVDAAVRSASFSEGAEAGSFTVPAYSFAVFVKVQGATQGTGLSPFATIGQPDTAPYGDTTVFIRGTMNDWSTNDAMAFTGSDTYEVTVALEADTQYEFKVASEDWSTVDFGASESNVVEAAQPLTLSRGGSNLNFTPANSGNYIFTVNATEAESPVLTIRTEEPFPGTTVLLRGTMNDWGESDAFTYISGGRYEISLNLSAGDYEFKVASADWSTVNYGANNGLLEGSTVSLSSNGANIALTIPADGDYVFVFDATNTDNASVGMFAAGMFGDTPVYVRGTMNGWSTDDEMSFDGSHVYSAILNLAPGNYEFKIGNEDWSEVDLGAGQDGNQIEFGKPLALAPVGGDIGISIDVAGNYRFELRGPSTDTPQVMIAPVE